MNDDEKLDYTLRVNREDRPLQGCHYSESLMHVLRYRLGLTGTKAACDDGRCGSCTVLIDGEAVNSCLELAAETVDREITTIEGYNPADGSLTPMQQAFVKHAAVQCGYCIPGIILAAESFLAKHPDATIEEIREGLDGNICRCTGYTSILTAIEEGARHRHDS